MNVAMPMMAMPLQQVHVARAPQVPVPPVSNTPLEISREARQQLRAIRRRAFERHQETAQWTKELLGGVHQEAPTSVISSHSTDQLQSQLTAKKQQLDVLQREMTQQQQEQEAAQTKFEELLKALKSVADAEALKQCQEQVDQEKKTLLVNKQRKMEIVRL